MRSILIFLVSAVLSAGVIANAVILKKQFYPSVVYISKSNPSMAVSLTLKLFQNSPVTLKLFLVFPGNLFSIFNISSYVRQVNEEGECLFV